MSDNPNFWVIIWVEKLIMSEEEDNGYQRLDRIIECHRGLIRRLCWRGTCGDEALCEDLVQDCYIAIWQRLGTLRSKASRLEEAAWVVWNCRSVLSHHKRRPSIETVTLDPCLADTLATPESNPHAALIDDLAACLTARERLALSLMLQDFTDLEIADRLGMRVDSFQRMRLRMIEKMKKNEEL